MRTTRLRNPQRRDGSRSRASLWTKWRKLPRSCCEIRRGNGSSRSLCALRKNDLYTRSTMHSERQSILSCHPCSRNDRSRDVYGRSTIASFFRTSLSAILANQLCSHKTQPSERRAMTLKAQAEQDVHRDKQLEMHLDTFLDSA